MDSIINQTLAQANPIKMVLPYNHLSVSPHILILYPIHFTAQDSIWSLIYFITPNCAADKSPSIAASPKRLTIHRTLLYASSEYPTRNFYMIIYVRIYGGDSSPSLQVLFHPHQRHVAMIKKVGERFGDDDIHTLFTLHISLAIYSCIYSHFPPTDERERQRSDDDRRRRVVNRQIILIKTLGRTFILCKIPSTIGEALKSKHTYIQIAGCVYVSSMSSYRIWKEYAIYIYIYIKCVPKPYFYYVQIYHLFSWKDRLNSAPLNASPHFRKTDARHMRRV